MASVRRSPEVVVAVIAGGGFILSFFAWLYGLQVLALVLLGVTGLYFLSSLAYLLWKRRAAR